MAPRTLRVKQLDLCRTLWQLGRATPRIVLAPAALPPKPSVQQPLGLAHPVEAAFSPKWQSFRRSLLLGVDGWPTVQE